MKKMFSLFAIFTFLFLLSCDDDSNVTNYNGGNADIFIDIINVPANSWIVNTGYDYQWYQEFILSGRDRSLGEYGTLIAYIKNQYGAWESLPYTSVMWTDDQIVYSEEMWYSYDDEYFFIDFRNTHPYNPAPPLNDIQIKIVIIENWYLNSIKEVNLDNHDEFMNIISTDALNNNINKNMLK